MEQSVNKKTVIECRGLCKTYGEGAEAVEVVRDFDLNVYENEFLVLFGPGQCGKTTLINMMAGLMQPDAGKVSMNGELVTAPGPERGVVYQTVSLFPWLTTMGNVEYGPKARGIPKNQYHQRAQYYIDLVGLHGFEKAYPIALSGGMKQRVGIARAYCNEPTVLLMDEPFSALDAQTRYLMQEELAKIWQKEKRTVIFVTNNVEEAVYLADRIVVLRECPTGIKKKYEITLPRPRDYVAPEFLRLRQEISSLINRSR